MRRRACLARLARIGLLAGVMPAFAQSQGSFTEEETWTDSTRGRQIPVKVRWPDAITHTGVRPVVIFSHGLGGTRDGGELWGSAWAQAGMVVIHLQHAGSDLTAVRRSASSFQDREGLRTAAVAQQLVARFADVAFALDELQRRHSGKVGRWALARPERVGMSGHSFGAHTTLGMAGQRYPGFDGIREPRLAAFIAFSPSLPPGDAKQAFQALTRPVLSVTGTRDQDVIGSGATPQRRIAVFNALPDGHKSHLVLAEADHMTFAGQSGQATEILPREQVTRNLHAAHHALVASITSNWWRATLLDDALAHSRLKAPTGLATGDRWETG